MHTSTQIDTYLIPASFVISLLISFLVLPYILQLSIKKRLFDRPSARKIHSTNIPRLGGLCFFPTFIFTLMLVLLIKDALGYEPSEWLGETVLLFCGMALLYLIGFIDDLVGVKAWKKLIVQIVCSAFFPLSGVVINNFYGLFGIHEIPFCLGCFFTMFMVVFITNAINLIDGIDGLASGLSGIALSILGVMFFKEHLVKYSILSAAMLGVLIPFFRHNVFGDPQKGTKIFMGDTGSLTLGYVMSFLAVKYAMNSPAEMPARPGALLMAFSTLLVPSFDVIRVTLLRLRKGFPIFRPDKNHIHHKFLRLGLSPMQTLVAILFLASGFFLMNYAMVHYYVNHVLIIILDIILWIAMHIYISAKIRSRYKKMKKDLHTSYKRA
jgi:UDP-N-acetylmuramyl pentapeptide phosphotransferase/UDP-N-acetylglucosamine-1-phosphate transferase